MSGRRLFFDVETHSAHLMYSLRPREFVRLIGYAWDDGPVVLTTDLNELRYQIMCADLVIGHNIHAFDLPACFGTKSDVPLLLAEQEKVVDTWIKAPLVVPAPYLYTNRNGRPTVCDEPEKMMKFYKLDELAFQLGVEGKTGDIRAMARQHGDPALTGEDRIRDGMGKIPLDDEEYREYLIGDVEATRAVYWALMDREPMSEYDWREQRIAARFAVVSANGFKVDQAAAQARVDELEARRRPIIDMMEEKYGLPSTGAAPWSTKVGKEAIFKALADHGITPESRPDWPRTDKKNLSLSGEALIMLTEGTEAEDLGRALAEVKGMRSLAALALETMFPDGFVHPGITMLQKSGRCSVTKPGLTVWTARGPGAIEKRYFVPDTKSEVLLEGDWSNADARVVAALSGDREYAKMFDEGVDSHLELAQEVWGKDKVGDDKSVPETAAFRQAAKTGRHGWGYRIGAKKLANSIGIPLEDSRRILTSLNDRYPGVVAWQDTMSARAAQDGYVVNEWGRKMWVDKDRAYTQGPALVGQSGTREIACDFLLSLPIRALRRVKAFIHDAFLFSVPKGKWREWRDYFASKMTSTMNPRGGQRIDFPVEFGPPAKNWYLASHS